MTNQPPNNQAGSQNFISKIAGGFGWWINSLMGKPQVPNIQKTQATAPLPPAPATPQTTTNTPAQPSAQAAPTPVDDSVSQDLMAVKKIVNVVSTKLKQNVAPQVNQGLNTSTQAAENFVKKNPQVLKKALIVGGVLVVVLLLGAIGMQIFRGMQNNQGDGGGNVSGNLTPTNAPTPITIIPKEPSVYSQDEVILKLEEDVEVMVREIQGTNIKETQINPPTLDFNITF